MVWCGGSIVGQAFGCTHKHKSWMPVILFRHSAWWCGVAAGKTYDIGKREGKGNTEAMLRISHRKVEEEIPMTFGNISRSHSVPSTVAAT